MTTLAKMHKFLATDTPFATLTQDFFNHNSTFSPLSCISDGAKSDLLVKMLLVGFTPKQCDLAAKAMQTTDQVALTFFSHATVATTVVPDTATLAAEKVADTAATKAVAKQVESDAKMAKEMQEEDEPKSGGGAATAVGVTTLPEPGPATTDCAHSALTSAWGKSSSGMSASKTKIMFDRMAMSAKANQAMCNSKMTPVKTPEDKLKEVTTKISALCNENKSAGFSDKRQSEIDKLKKEQEKLNKQIAATRPTCQTCGSGVSIFNGVPNQLCSACYKASIRPSSVIPGGKSYGKKGNNPRQMTLTDRRTLPER